MKALTLLLALVLITSCTETPQTQFESLEFVVGLEANYPPLALKNESGEVVGFDVDVLSAVCAEVKCTFSLEEVTPFEALFPALEANEFDVAAGGLSITTDRKAKFKATSSYFSPSTNERLGFYTQEQSLKDRLDEGIKRVSANGKLKTILSKWDLD